MVQHREDSFAGANGVTLYSQSWWPEREVRAAVAVVHGIGEHSGRYTSLVDHLTKAGFAVFAFDHRGHGKSPGARGHIGSWSEYREDVRRFLEHVRSQVPDRPVFLYGHSLGALVVAEYVLSHQEGLAGLIVSGIPLEPKGVAKPHLVLLARILSRVRPTFSVALKVDAAALSRDQAVARAYNEDPLVHHMGSVRWGTETLAAIARVRSRAAEIRLPLLVVHGGSDRVNLVEGSRELFEKASSNDKQIIIYPGGAHEPHNDLDRDQLARDVEEWLVRHLEATDTTPARSVTERAS